MSNPNNELATTLEGICTRLRTKAEWWRTCPDPHGIGEPVRIALLETAFVFEETANELKKKTDGIEKIPVENSKEFFHVKSRGRLFTCNCANNIFAHPPEEPHLYECVRCKEWWDTDSIR